MPHIRLPAINLYYEDSGGAGEPVVFMHAASSSSESWVFQVPVFSQAGFRCIAWDRRGWGRSQPDPGMEQDGHACDDLFGLVEQLKLDRVHLVSTAAGGLSALDFALSYPDRVRSLAVADSIGGVSDPEYLEVQDRLRPPEIRALPVYLRELSAGYRGTQPEGTRRWIENHERARLPGNPNQQLKQKLTLGLLGQLSLPCLIVAGEADLVTPPAFMRLLAAAIPGCRFATVPEAGHAAHWEQPEAWNEVVIEFLREVVASPPSA